MGTCLVWVQLIRNRRWSRNNLNRKQICCQSLNEEIYLVMKRKRIYLLLKVNPLSSNSKKNLMLQLVLDHQHWQNNLSLLMMIHTIFLNLDHRIRQLRKTLRIYLMNQMMILDLQLLSQRLKLKLHHLQYRKQRLLNQ